MDIKVARCPDCKKWFKLVDEPITRMYMFRLERNMSLRKLAKMTGLEVKTIRSVEMAEHRPQFATAVKIANVLGFNGDLYNLFEVVM